MSKITEGVLIFNNWFEAARLLSGPEFKKLLIAIYEYQIYGKQPPTFTPKGEALARSIFPLIEKRVKGAMWAKQGLEKKQDTPQGVPMGVSAVEPVGEPTGVKSYTPYPKEYKRKENIRISSEEEAEKESWYEFFDRASNKYMETEMPADEPPAPDKKD